MSESYPKLRDLLLGLSTPGGDLHFLKANCGPLREELSDLLSRVEVQEAPSFGPCDMGVGCDEAGACFAAAQGQPERCSRHP